MVSSSFEEAGLFWDAGETVPPGAFAPGNAVEGTLHIEPTGSIRITLSNILRPPSNGTARSVFDPRTIVGILRRTEHAHVRIENAVLRNAQISSHRPSHESYSALACLVSDDAVSVREPVSGIVAVEVELNGFAAWLDVGPPYPASAGGHPDPRFFTREECAYDTAAGRMILVAEPWRSYELSTDKISLSRRTTIKFEPLAHVDWQSARDFISKIERLLQLLTNRRRALSAPDIAFGDARKGGVLHFARQFDEPEEIGPDDPWVKFSSIKEEFGQIAAAWMEKWDTYGAAFHMFFANASGKSVFVEHAFASLVWGLEALHRQRPARERGALQVKIDRILATVGDRDRRWLGLVLRNSGEPSLAERHKDHCTTLLLQLQPERIRQFAENCADLRNDISHFGGPRSGRSYVEFTQLLWAMTMALSPIYHARLLLEIGVSPHLIRNIFVAGPHSNKLDQYFSYVGLTNGRLR